MATKGRKSQHAGRESSRLSKTVSPRLAIVFPRARLFSQLDQALSGAPRVWIEGPPGAGKTTLAASWLDARALPRLWYQVDTADRDIASFFHHLGIAVARAAPRYRQPLPKLTPEYRGDLPTFARNFFRELGRRLPPKAVLVFDDLHELGQDSLPLDALRVGLETLPRGSRAVLVSRAAPPGTFARSRLERRLEVIDWSSLQLQEAESVALVKFLERQGARNTPRATVSGLHGACNGWLAGLLLLAEGAGPVSAPHGPLDPVSAQRLFDYFAGEVFTRRDAGVKKLLMETALFPRFTAEMAGRLTGYLRAQAALEDLVRQNHFIERSIEGAVTYQYHPLFRAFLIEQGRQAWTDSELFERRRLAASILESAGRSEDALALSLDCGESNAATRLILAEAPGLCAAGRLESLAAAIGRLPAGATEQEPWLIYWRGVSLAFFDPEAGERDFALAYERFEKRGDAAGAYLSWAGVVDAIWQQQRDWSRLGGWIERLEAKLQREGTFPSDEIASRVVSSLFWAIHWHATDHPSAAKWEEEAARLWDSTSDPSIRLRLGLALQYHYMHSANAPRLAILTETQRRLARRRDVPPSVTLLAHMADILTFCMACAPLAETLKRTREALAIGSACGVHAFDAVYYGSALFAILSAEDLTTADKWLEAFHATIASHPTNLDTALYRVQCSWRARLKKEPARAVELAKSALEIARSVGAYEPQVICRQALVHAFVLSQDLDGARRENELAMSRARAANMHWEVFHCMLLDASLAFAAGDEARGVERLREALRIQERLDIPCYLCLWSKDAIERLCLKAFEHGLATPYVHRVLQVYDIRPADPPVHLETWPFEVKIYVLGRFSLLRDGKPVRFAAKAQKRPLQLLKALVALGGRAVKEDRLADALWPGAEGDSAIRALGTTLHRLRKMCGDRAIRRQEGRLTLDPRHCWVDAWALERQLTALENGAPVTAAQAADRLLALYRGPFLAEEADQAWALSARDRLRSKFLRALESAGTMLGKAGDHEGAIRCFTKGIEVDVLAENFHRCLIACCLALGRKAEAASAYERCRKVLDAHLGLMPSPETQALYRQIGRD